MGTPSATVSPGLGAFVAFFVLAVALWLLLRNMNARMRRMAYREQERLKALEAEQAAAPSEQAPQVERPQDFPAGGVPDTGKAERGRGQE